MSRFDIFLIGSSQILPLEIESNDLHSLAIYLAHQRFLVGRFAPQAADMNMREVMIPISRINFLYEAEI